MTDLLSIFFQQQEEALGVDPKPRGQVVGDAGRPASRARRAVHLGRHRPLAAAGAGASGRGPSRLGGLLRRGEAATRPLEDHPEPGPVEFHSIFACLCSIIYHR